MHRYFFSLRIALLVVLAAIVVASVDLAVNGFAVVSDPDRQLVSAALVDGTGAERQAMREFAAGYWGARPSRDGAISMRCRTGREVAGGYVTQGMRTTYTVRREDCAAVAAPASPA